MRRATITLPDELDARVAAFLAGQEPEPSLTALVQTALERYLDQIEWNRRGFKRPAGSLRITPAPKGSGHRDSSVDHDRVLAERS